MAVFLSIGLDQKLQEELRAFAAENAHELFLADSCQEAQAALGFYACDLVFAMLESSHKDLWPTVMPLTQLPGLPDIIAVVLGQDAEAGAFAIQSGCWDVLSLPCESMAIRSAIKRCLADRKILDEQSSPLSLKREQIIGNSPALQRLLQQLGVIAASDSSVLIMGETGTGKELFAQAIHDNSPRAGKPLIVVDCTNLPETLAESLLFGHARGSFTGAVESTDGLFKQADGGTIFLDEIGELKINVQKSLLRVIQEKRFRPLSAKKEISCDFRLIAATNQDLEAMVRNGTFRQDLYHRINSKTIILPPLRDRIEDIPALFRHYVDRFSQSQNLPVKEVAPETIEALKIYPWPGNVREMVNVAESAVLKAHSLERIYPQHLPDDIRLFLVRSNITLQNLLTIASETTNQEQDADVSVQTLARQSSADGSSLFASTGKNRSIISGLSQNDTIFMQLNQIQSSQKQPSFEVSSLDFSSMDKLPSFKQVRKKFVGKLETQYFSELIRRCEGNFARAQEISGLSRARLYDILKHNHLAI